MLGLEPLCFAMGFTLCFAHLHQCSPGLSCYLGQTGTGGRERAGK